MAENITPNVPNIQPPTVPADLEPEKNAAPKSAAKSSKAKVWLGAILGTLLVGGGIFAGVFYSNQTELFTGNITSGDLAGVTPVVDETNLNLTFASEALEYADAGVAPEFYENNIILELRYNTDSLATDPTTSDEYLLVYDDGFEETGTLVSLSKISGKDNTVIAWQDASDVLDTFDKPRAKILVVEEADDGSISQMIESNAVVLAPVLADPMSTFKFTSPSFEIGTDTGLTISSILLNESDESSYLASRLSSTALRVSNGSASTNINLDGFTFVPGSLANVTTLLEAERDFFVTNGDGDYSFEIIYAFDTGRTGFACGIGEVAPCDDEIPTERQEDSSFEIITQAETLAITVGDGESGALACETDITFTVTGGATGPYYAGNNYPVTFNLANASTEEFQYIFVIDDAVTRYPAGDNPFTTDVISGAQRLAGGANQDFVVNFDPTQLGNHDLGVLVTPTAASATTCPDFRAEQAVNFVVTEAPALACTDLATLVTITEGADNNIEPSSEIDTTYTNTYEIVSTHTEDLAIDLSLDTGDATAYTWTVNGTAVTGDTASVNTGVEGVPIPVVVTFTAPAEPAEFNNVDLIISSTVATEDCALFEDELDTEVRNPEANTCTTEQQAIIDASVAELPELSAADYQEEFADMLEDLESNSDLEGCDLPEEPESCTDEQQDAMDDIFDSYDLDDPTDSDYEDDFEDYLDEVASYPNSCEREDESQCTDEQQDQIDEEFAALDPTEDSYEEDYTALEDVYSNDDDYATCTIPDEQDEDDEGDDPEDIVQTEADILAQQTIIPGTTIIPDTRPVAPVYNSGAVASSPGIQGDTGPGLIAYPVLVGMASVFARRRKQD